MAASTKNKVSMESAKREFLLEFTDRCDSCGAQAFVCVRGMTGELMFCSHHYTKIMKNADSYVALSSFAIETIDERERLDLYEKQRTAV